MGKGQNCALQLFVDACSRMVTEQISYTGGESGQIPIPIIILCLTHQEFIIFLSGFNGCEERKMIMNVGDTGHLY